MPTYRDISRALPRLWRRFRMDERGVVSILGAFAILLGLALSVIVVDVGHFYLAKRRLQSAVDAAALSALSAKGDAAGAQSIAQTAVSRNGYGSAQLVVETGRYTADPAIAVTARFDPTATTQKNAVRVTGTIQSPGFFAGILHLASLSSVKAMAIAAQTPEVSYSAGTALAELDDSSGINLMLNAMLGTSLNLGILDYRNIADVQVNALDMLDQLASQVNLNAGTYQDLANTSINLAQYLAAAKAALGTDPANAAALQSLTLLQNEISPATLAAVSVPMNALVDFSLWEKRKIGSILQQNDPQNQTNVNLFNLLTAVARIYAAGQSAGHGISLQLASVLPSLPGLNNSVTAKLYLQQPMVSDTIAQVGDKISTAQVRLLLEVKSSLSLLGLVTADIDLPMVVQMAAGTATVTDLPCNSGGVRAVIGAQTQIASLQYGTATDAQMADFSQPSVTPSAAPAIKLTALSVLLGGITVATVTLPNIPATTGATSTPMSFTQTDIDNRTIQTAGSDVTGLFSTLGAAVPTISILPGTLLTVSLNGSKSSLLSGLMTQILGLLSPVGLLVNNLLDAIGLRLGAMDVIVHSVNCSRPTLVG